ncbi:MAG: saccharopine dehydrogenase NADP-binding domain-containing protein, partial [Campylobacterales bacterium]|nr:saccharopine dehydrogenase NADP-binding domain-containing protein [Campylobacterales bacterium]
MKTTLIIGAGGVGRVVVHKCVQNADIFGKIVLASRRLESCQTIKDELPDANIEVAKVDADVVDEIVALIEDVKADIVINVALPYQDLAIMDACIKTKVPYLDTANYEHPDEAKFEYKLQWERDEKFKEAGIMGLLGSGFDPGATNI